MWNDLGMDVHLIDGTYELFRQFYAPRGGHRNDAGDEVGAVRGVLRSTLSLIAYGATHLGVATDHVITSFRNDLWAGYKTGDGIDPDLFAQFPLLEEGLAALGVTVWPMVEYEADDALGAAAAVAARHPDLGRALICTPDKDLAQCVQDPRVAQFDRRADVIRDEAAVQEKFGVAPESIPDWLALVGDSADGFPGIAGWGAKTAAAVLSVYRHLEAIPHAPGQWDVPGVRGIPRLATALADNYEDALLFKRLATLVTDIDVGTVESWHWAGPTAALDAFAARVDAPDVVRNATRIANSRAAATQ